MKEVNEVLSIFEVTKQKSESDEKLSQSNLLSGSKVMKEVMEEVSEENISLEVKEKFKFEQIICYKLRSQYQTSPSSKKINY